ncbi:unnamed protein product, partial [Gadus morhua 'NCC']
MRTLRDGSWVGSCSPGGVDGRGVFRVRQWRVCVSVCSVRGGCPPSAGRVRICARMLLSRLGGPF